MLLPAVAAGALGLLVGSFLNVVVHRVPRGESLLRPASRCPGCGHPVRPRDNVPVLGWLLLRGRCRDCGTGIGARYPAVELLTALVFAVLTLRIGPGWSLPAFLYLGAAGVALAAIDIDTRRLPDAIVLPSYAVGAALLVPAAAAGGAWPHYGRALLAALALFAFYLALALVYPAGMGFGDVKLAGLLGLYLGWLGWGELLVGAFLGFLLGALAGGGLMLAGRATGKTAIPYGPFMLLGALVAVCVGGPLAQLYTGAFLAAP